MLKYKSMEYGIQYAHYLGQTQGNWSILAGIVSIGTQGQLKNAVWNAKNKYRRTMLVKNK